MGDRYHLTRNNRPSLPISVTPAAWLEAGHTSSSVFVPGLDSRCLVLSQPVRTRLTPLYQVLHTHFLPLISRGSSALAFSHLSDDGPVRYPPQIPSNQALSYCSLGGLPTDSLAYGSLSYEDTTHAPVREFLLATSSHSLTFVDAAPSDRLHSSTNIHLMPPEALV